MCGIAGFRLVDEDLWMDTAAITAALGKGILPRGNHASGICTVSPRGRVKNRKAGEAMDVFLARHEGIGAGAKLALIHTRFGTQGEPTNNLNNHPIEYANLIGIHNGMIWNDDAIFRQLGLPRLGQVDSEAIWASMSYHGPVKGLAEVCGSLAVAWIDVREPLTLNLAKGDNPLVYVRSMAGSIFFASTESAVLAGVRAAGLTAAVANVNVMHCEDMLMIDQDGDDWKVEHDAFNYDGGYSHYSASYGGVVTSGKSTTVLGRTPNPNPSSSTQLSLPKGSTTTTFTTKTSVKNLTTDEEDLDAWWDSKVGDYERGDGVYIMTEDKIRCYGQVLDVDPQSGKVFVALDDQEFSPHQLIPTLGTLARWDEEIGSNNDVTEELN